MITCAVLSWWVMLASPSMPAYYVKGSRWSYESSVRLAAQATLTPDWIAAAIPRAETEFDHMAVSPAGARGLFQILERDQEWLVSEHLGSGFVFHWDDPGHSALLGLAYFAALKKRFGSDHLAAAAYNMGPTALAQGRALPAKTRSYLRRIFG